ncbi:hypothetical protein F5Y11DRAFT_363873 [Daldinia sp. FL1419]|nr:hypothetical protein F5Y11DRAFT_363873 [Daldinia sp. FL1419]
MDTSIEAMQTFPQFRNLPPEIRLMVWDYCLPRRVVPLHDTKFIESWRDVAAVDNTPIACPNPPVISQVCRESRDFALMHGRLENTAFWGTPVWFNRRIDTLHVEYDCYQEFSRSGGKCIENGMMQLAYRHDIPLMIEHDVFSFSFSSPFPGPYAGSDFTRWAIQRLAGRAECTVVLRDAPIHMEYQDACASGLFGLFAETPGYVNVHDPKQIDRLNAISRKAPANAEFNKKIHWIVEHFIPTHTYEKDIDRFLQDVRTLWLKEKDALPDFFAPGDFKNQEDFMKPYSKFLDQLPKFNFVVGLYFHDIPVDSPDVDEGQKKKPYPYRNPRYFPLTWDRVYLTWHFSNEIHDRKYI